jgi:hypothetical protein
VYDLRRPSRIANSFIHQPPTVNVKAVTPEAPARSACVLVLDEKGKFSVGFDERSADTFVSLVACDLYNASRAAQSTELLGGASLSARNIFLSGGYALSAGSVMTASRYLTTHTAPAADPYIGLELPDFTGCTRTRYRLGERRIETISPGVYCGGIEVAGGATLNFDPGTYILDRGDFAVSGNSKVNGHGVTLILTSGTRSNYGAIDIRPGSAIEVTAPALGAAVGIPGITIWADGPGSAANDAFEGGSTQNINGTIYMPDREVRYSGGSPATHCSQLVARAITFTGSSYFRHDCARIALSDPDPPRLVAE